MATLNGYSRETIELVNSSISLRKTLSPSDYRPVIKVVSDYLNNVNRVCTIGNKFGGRNWQIVTAMADQKRERYYLVSNLKTRERRLVHYSVIGNMY